MNISSGIILFLEWRKFHNFLEHPVNPVTDGVSQNDGEWDLPVATDSRHGRQLLKKLMFGGSTTTTAPSMLENERDWSISNDQNDEKSFGQSGKCFY